MSYGSSGHAWPESGFPVSGQVDVGIIENQRPRVAAIGVANACRRT